MRTPNWKPEKVWHDGEFSYVLSFQPEHAEAKRHFTVECGWSDEEYREIADFYWFCAKVTAYKGSIACGDAYLGGNCYKTKAEVMADGQVENILSGYMPQLIEEARSDAEENFNAEPIAA